MSGDDEKAAEPDQFCRHCSRPIEPATEPNIGASWQHTDTTAIMCHWPAFRGTLADPIPPPAGG